MVLPLTLSSVPGISTRAEMTISRPKICGSHPNTEHINASALPAPVGTAPTITDAANARPITVSAEPALSNVMPESIIANTFYRQSGYVPPDC